LLNQLLIGVQTEERIPLFPLHLLQKGDERFEILAGWEALDAARRAGSRKIQAVFYNETDIHIETPATGFYDINYAGREKRYAPDPKTGDPIAVTTIPARTYREVYELGELPDMPGLDNSGAIWEGYDTHALEQWFYDYCEEKAFAIYRRAQQDLGHRAMDDANLQEYMNRYPEEGKYYFYYNFFVNRGAGPGMLKDLAAEYADFGREVGQTPEHLFSEKEMVRSLMDVYRRQFQRYYNKFVFAGATAVGLGDIQQTPYGTMTGISTIVNAFNTIVTQNFLKISSGIPGLDVVLLFCLSMLCCFAYGLSSVRISSLLFVLLLTGTFVTGVILFDAQNLYLKSMPLLFTNAGIFVFSIMYKVFTEQKARRFLKSTFSSYLAPEIIEEMVATRTMPTLGGEARMITAYFTDIQRFSTLSEKLTAYQLVELINDYLSAMTDILIGEGGTLDKYEGDAIIAFFGAPMTLPDHPLRACRAALAMQNRLMELRQKWAGEKQGADEPDPNTRKVRPGDWLPGDRWPRIVHEMRMRIGINTGEIVVGNMGSSMRMNYTMMGDPVNLAARLEAAAKQYGVYILVSEYVLEQEIIKETGRKTRVMDLVEARLLDKIIVVGKSEPVRVYELCAMKGELSEKEKNLIEVFDRGMAHYQRMEWDKAIALFSEAVKLEPTPDAIINPSLVYIQRCRAFKQPPPVTASGKTWDGVYRLTRK
jgi:class 3 adenylate cyclase